MKIIFEEIITRVSSDLEKLDLEREQSYAGSGFPPNNAFYFQKDEDVLSAFFSMTCQKNSITSLEDAYRKAYGGNFYSRVEKDGLLHNVEFRFYKNF